MSNKSGKNKRVCIAFATGCPRSKMDAAWMFPYFKANGYEIVRSAKKADLIVATACGFDAATEAESIRRLALISSKRAKGAKMIITGCLAGIDNPEVVERFKAIIIKPAEYEKLDDTINARVKLHDVPPVNYLYPYINDAKLPFPYAEMNPQASRTEIIKHHVKNAVQYLCRCSRVDKLARVIVSGSKRINLNSRVFCVRAARGCLEECSYCIIKNATGSLRSKPIESILSEFDSGLQQGFTRFEIIAEDLGCYGIDINSDLPTLLRALLERAGNFNFILTDVNARYFIRYQKQLSRLLADHAKKFARIKVPVQSGSDRILQLMKRCYTAAEAIGALKQITSVAPKVSIETHVLVGFPSETEQDFSDTVNLLRTVNLDRIQVYKYADRPGTAASQLSEKVPDHLKDERFNAILSQFPNAVSCSY